MFCILSRLCLKLKYREMKFKILSCFLMQKKQRKFQTIHGYNVQLRIYWVRLNVKSTFIIGSTNLHNFYVNNVEVNEVLKVRNF